MIVLLFIVISLIESSSSESLPNIKKITNKLPDYTKIFSKSRYKVFDKWAVKIYRTYLEENIKDNSEEIRIAALSANASVYDPRELIVLIPEFKVEGSEQPVLLPFEPKLTLGMILNDYNSQLKNADDPKNFQYTLPVFHWADWTDLSILDPHLTSFGEERQTCKMFAKIPRKTRNNPNPEPTPPDWCINDSDVARIDKGNSETDPKKRASLKEILQSTFRTGFHIDRYSGRRPDKFKRLEGASYLHDFMDKPLSVVLVISDHSGRLKALPLNVNHEVGSRQRLSQSTLGNSVAGRVKQTDLRSELKQLWSTFKLEDNQKFLHEIDLSHEDFVDDLKNKLEELSSKKELSPQELNYYQSLNLSLSDVESTKYLFEAEIAKTTSNWAYGAHYDWRFYKELINFSPLQGPSLHGLTLAWLRFVHSQGLRSWLAHGSLLSWYWNGITFPWDADIDVQMPIQELHKLARSFNQSVIVDFGPDINGEIRTGRYFLDIGTWISRREFGNGLNNIDARFIDMDTGLYIDITGLAISNHVAPMEYDTLLPKKLRRPSKLRISDEYDIARNTFLQVYNCRNKHFAALKDLSPLKLSYMEGTPTYVPNNFMKFLRGEYRSGGVADRKFKKYVYLPRLRIWHPIDTVSRYASSKNKEGTKTLTLGSDRSKLRKNVDYSVYTLSDEDYLEIMARDKLLLVEYLATRAYTEFHETEMKNLLKNQNTELLILEDGSLRHHFPSMRKEFLKVKHAKEVVEEVPFIQDVEEYKAKNPDKFVNEKSARNGMPKLIRKTEADASPVQFQPEGAAMERPRPDMG